MIADFGKKINAVVINKAQQRFAGETLIFG